MCVLPHVRPIIAPLYAALAAHATDEAAARRFAGFRAAGSAVAAARSGCSRRTGCSAAARTATSAAKLQVRIRQLCAVGLFWYDTSNGRLSRGLRASDLPFWLFLAPKKKHEKPVMDRFQLERPLDGAPTSGKCSPQELAAT